MMLDVLVFRDTTAWLSSVVHRTSVSVRVLYLHYTMVASRGAELSSLSMVLLSLCRVHSSWPETLSLVRTMCCCSLL